MKVLTSLHRTVCVKKKYRAGEDITFADLVLGPFAARDYILKEHRGFDDNLLSSEYRGETHSHIDIGRRIANEPFPQSTIYFPPATILSHVECIYAYLILQLGATLYLPVQA